MGFIIGFLHILMIVPYSNASPSLMDLYHPFSHWPLLYSNVSPSVPMPLSSHSTKKIQVFFLNLQCEKRTRRLEKKLSQQPKQAKDGVWG